MAEIADRLEAAAKNLREMHADGLILTEEMTDDYACLVTNNPLVAAKYEMYEQENDEEDFDEIFPEPGQ